MAEDVIEFLRNKFIDGLAEVEDQGRQLPRHRQFEEIRKLLVERDMASSTIDHMIKMKNTLYWLLAVFTDCLIFSEKHPIRRTRFLLHFYHLFHFFFLKRTREELEKIRKELEKYLGPKRGSDGADNRIQCSEIIWHSHVSEIRGFYPQSSKIRDWLLLSKGFKDIAIVGIGGSGKTALARQLFHDEDIQSAFSTTLWISISRKIDAGIDLKQVVEDMLVELTTEDTHEKLGSCSTEELLSSLRHRLLGKKYLVVFDGIWDENQDWYFRLGQALNWPDKSCNTQSDREQKSNENAVIITTRLEEVAKGMVGEKYLHSMEGIGDDKIWSVFKDAVDATELSAQLTEKLKKLKNEIVKRCDGFPLGAKTLAKIIPKALVVDSSSVNAESDNSPATQNQMQNQRSNTSTEIIPMQA